MKLRDLVNKVVICYTKWGETTADIGARFMIARRVESETGLMV